MVPPATRRSPLGTPTVRRFLGGLCLLIILAVAAGGALAARPAGPSDRAAAGTTSGAETPLDVSLDPVDAVVPGPPASAPAAAVLPPPAPAPTPTAVPATPTPRPVADLNAAPPAPDPNLPAWAVGAREASLWSAATGGTEFTKVPAGATFRVFERQANRLRVYYPGDLGKRVPGEAWVDAADLTAAPWPHWVRLRGPAPVMTVPSFDGATVAPLRPGTFVEVVGQPRGSWAKVFLIGDGRSEPVEGWLVADAAAPIPGPDQISTFALSQELVASGGPDVWLKVPYRSQLDGTRYAAANCGPTTTGMVLESFGIAIPQPALRREVLAYQPAEDCDDCGVYLQNMAAAIASRDLKVNNLRDPDKPNDFHRWTLDEIRSEVRAGHPVVVQVFYRGLPGRANSAYWGDHYVVVHGLAGDRFIINDPIDSDGPGYSRLMTARALDFAMSQSDFPYAAFSVSR